MSTFSQHDTNDPKIMTLSGILHSQVKTSL